MYRLDALFFLALLLTLPLANATILRSDLEDLLEKGTCLVPSEWSSKVPMEKGLHTLNVFFDFLAERAYLKSGDAKGKGPNSLKAILSILFPYENIALSTVDLQDEHGRPFSDQILIEKVLVSVGQHVDNVKLVPVALVTNKKQAYVSFPSPSNFSLIFVTRIQAVKAQQASKCRMTFWSFSGQKKPCNPSRLKPSLDSLLQRVRVEEILANLPKLIWDQPPTAGSGSIRGIAQQRALYALDLLLSLQAMQQTLQWESPRLRIKSSHHQFDSNYERILGAGIIKFPSVHRVDAVPYQVYPKEAFQHSVVVFPPSHRHFLNPIKAPSMWYFRGPTCQDPTQWLLPYSRYTYAPSIIILPSKKYDSSKSNRWPSKLIALIKQLGHIKVFGGKDVFSLRDFHEAVLGAYIVGRRESIIPFKVSPAKQYENVLRVPVPLNDLEPIMVERLNVGIFKEHVSQKPVLLSGMPLCYGFVGPTQRIFLDKNRDKGCLFPPLPPYIVMLPDMTALDRISIFDHKKKTDEDCIDVPAGSPLAHITPKAFFGRGVKFVWA